jgi:diguanylate cyclase (GGDEF)-like protein
MAVTEARAALRMSGETAVARVVDEDARDDQTGPTPIVCVVPFGQGEVGSLALAPGLGCEADTAELVALVARELGGAVRITMLMDESQRLATTDPLTGLMNRRAFLSMMKVEVERSQRYGLPLSLLLFDVDHFKAVNDTHGHAGGDKVLAQIGDQLRAVLRTPDSPARWGGEEFVIALKNTGLSGGSVVAERLRRTLQALPIPFGSATLEVTVSVGVASLQAKESLDTLIERADRAMYAAKLAGRNRVSVSEHEVTVVCEPERDVKTA